MRPRIGTSLLCGLAVLATAGCVTFTEPPARPGTAPTTVQRIIANDAYALNSLGEPRTDAALEPSPDQFAWEKSLRDNPAARSLVFDSFHGPAAGMDFSDYYNDYLLF